MLQNNSLVKNTALLTVSALFMRFVGMGWQIWLVGKIGEDGIGLYQLILSIAALAAAFAVSGIRFTTTRLVSEQMGSGREENISSVMKSCLRYGMFFGFAACFILFSCAEVFGFLWLSDARTVPALRCFAASLPFLSVSTVISGYFTAVKKVRKSIIVQIARELLMIAVTVFLLRNYIRGDIKAACTAIFGGGAIADFVAATALLLVYNNDKKHRRAVQIKSKDTDAKMLSVALPLAAASYARSGLSALQHILIPKGLRASGLTAAAALSAYGVIQGMALPVVLFPSCLMMSLAEMLVPELTCAQAAGNTAYIKQVTENILRKSFMFAAGIASCFVFLGSELGTVIYDSAEAGHYIRIFALLVPVMYMDTVTDGCLKGLGQMMFCMVVNIADAGLSALLVYLFLPLRGIQAYIGMIFFTECFNFLFSFCRLKRIAGIRIDILFLLKTAGVSLISAAAAKALNTAISAGSNVPTLIASLLFGAIICTGLSLSALRRQ